jgi:hypothetical protein
VAAAMQLDCLIAMRMQIRSFCWVCAVFADTGLSKSVQRLWHDDNAVP